MFVVTQKKGNFQEVTGAPGNQTGGSRYLRAYDNAFRHTNAKCRFKIAGAVTDRH